MSLHRYKNWALPQPNRSEAEVSAVQETPKYQGILVRRLFYPLQSVDLEGKEALEEPKSVTQQQGSQQHVGLSFKVN